MEVKHQITRESRAGARSLLPGVTARGDTAVGLDKGQLKTDNKPSSVDPGLQLKPSKSGSHNPPCDGTKANGARCGMRTTKEVILADGRTRAWLCRHHRTKDMTLLKDTVRVAQPPVTMLRTKADAERFLQWLLKSAVAKAYNAAEVKGILMIVSRWDRVRQREEQTVRAGIQALYDRMKAEVQRIRDEARGVSDQTALMEELIGYWRAEFGRVTGGPVRVPAPAERDDGSDDE